MNIAEWLAAARADAEARGLSELLPMLDGLAQATERLRAADWNDNANQDPFDAIESEGRLDRAQGKRFDPADSDRFDFAQGKPAV